MKGGEAGRFEAELAFPDPWLIVEEDGSGEDDFAEENVSVWDYVWSLTPFSPPLHRRYPDDFGTSI